MSLSQEELNNNLLLGAANGDETAVKTSLQNGANVNSKDAHQVSALTYSVYNSHMNIVNILIDSGADLTIRDTFNYNGFTPLHFASASGRIEMVKTLLRNPHQQQIHVPDGNGQLPIHVAQNDEIKQLLEDSMKNFKPESNEQQIPVQQQPTTTTTNTTTEQQQQFPQQQQSSPVCSDRRKKCKKWLKKIGIGILIALPILYCFFSPYSYPWFLIPYTVVGLIIGTIKIKKQQFENVEKKFYLHALYYIGINGFFFISNIWFGGFPWFIWPTCLWGILFGIHALKSIFKDTKYNKGFYIHLLCYILISTLLFITMCFGTCHVHRDSYCIDRNYNRGEFKARYIVNHPKPQRRNHRWYHHMRSHHHKRPHPVHHKIMEGGKRMHLLSAPLPPNANSHNPTYRPCSRTHTREWKHCSRSPGTLFFFLAPIFIWGLGILYHYLKFTGKLNLCHISVQLNNNQQQAPQPQQYYQNQQVPPQPPQQPPQQPIYPQPPQESQINEDPKASLVSNDVEQQNTMYPKPSL